MYLTNRAPARGRGFGQIIGPRPFLIRRSRGFGASGSTQATCTSPNYWDAGISTCCAPTGTPPAQDPCSILNQPGYLAAQAADLGPVGSSSGGVDQSILNSLAMYPNNVQTDAINCYTNPPGSPQNPSGTITGVLGNTVQCPPGISNSNGVIFSSLSQAQIAAYIANNEATGNLVGNQPYAALPSSPTEGLTPTPAATSYPVSLRLVNKSGGSNSSFNVGDSWQIIVSGPPNSQVTASATQNGVNAGSGTVMGTIGSNGQLVLTGTFGASQAGSWTETWMVGNQSAGSISFSVGSSGSSGGGSTGGGGSSGGGSNSSTSCFSFYSGDTCWGPVGMLTALTIGGVALAGMFLLGGRR